MSGVNRCTIIGRAGRDPETRTTANGAVVCSFSLAVSETWKDKVSGEKKESTTWVPIVVWGPLADIAGKYIRKGSQVYVCGKFSVRKWQDKNGADRYSTEVVLQGFNAELVLLDSKPSGAPARGGNYAEKQVADWDDAPADAAVFDFDDKVPF